MFAIYTPWKTLEDLWLQLPQHTHLLFQSLYHYGTRWAYQTYDAIAIELCTRPNSLKNTCISGAFLS